MPVYPAAARSATRCASPGCLCHDRVPRYPSDLTDEQWAVLEPRARQVMRDLTVAVGRPMVHDLRAMCDAVAYVVKNGIEWRALPVDFPHWEAAYAFYERWNGRGLPLELIGRLREPLRQHQGRAAEPSACIVDSQIVKAHDTVSKKTSGYHGGKKITGRGRHLAVDCEGWLLALVVTAASVSDKAGAMSRAMTSRSWAAVTSVASSAGPSWAASSGSVQEVRPGSSAATHEYGQPGIILGVPFAARVHVAEQPLRAGLRVRPQPVRDIAGQPDPAVVPPARWPSHVTTTRWVTQATQDDPGNMG
jgi:transposase